MRSICRLNECEKFVHGDGLCSTHLKRFRRQGNFQEKYIWKGRPCSIEGCNKPIQSKRMCSMHYGRLVNTGNVGIAGTYRRGGAKKHDLNGVYNNMKSRCYRKSNAHYPNYGGRGIKVCDRWMESFWNFVEDMADRPTPQHQLERIDNDGDYSPENCKWATSKEQSLNKRTNRKITFDGSTLTLIEWSKRTGIHRATLSDRMDKLGWSVEDALTKPVRRN